MLIEGHPFLQALIVHCYSSSDLRDGPLENFMGEQAKYQKNIRAREN